MAQGPRSIKDERACRRTTQTAHRGSLPADAFGVSHERPSFAANINVTVPEATLDPERNRMSSHLQGM